MTMFVKEKTNVQIIEELHILHALTSYIKNNGFKSIHNVCYLPNGDLSEFTFYVDDLTMLYFIETQHCLEYIRKTFPKNKFVHTIRFNHNLDELNVFWKYNGGRGLIRNPYSSNNIKI